MFNLFSTLVIRKFYLITRYNILYLLECLKTNQSGNKYWER